MLCDRIDIHRLRSDIIAGALEHTAIKRVLRTRWVRPMAAEQRRLARLRREATERLVLLAWSRGRLHVKMPPRAVRDAGLAWDATAHAERVAARVALDYVPAAESEAQP
jgi:hypothetical protein